MIDRSRRLAVSKIAFACLAAGMALVLAISIAGQTPVLTLLSREGRRTLPLSIVADQEFVSLDDLATAFQLTVREESGALTVSYKGRTILLTPDQALASIAGRLISLPARPIRANNRWLLPVEFISRALASIYDTRLDLRRASRTLVVGDLRMPQVTIRHEPLGNSARVTIDATPRTASTVTQEGTHLTVRFDADALDVTTPPVQSQGFVLAVRLVDTVTLAVDLGPRFASFKSTTETIDTTTRLVIDIGGQPDASTSAAPALPSEIPNLRPPASPITTIVIDPGHGGADAGATGLAGTIEKELTLAVARRLEAALEAQLGVRVILTRDDDRGLSLDERSAIANNNKADLFVSLHANWSWRPTAGGATIHVASFDEGNRSRAAVPPERVGVVGGGMRDISMVPWVVAQARFLSQSFDAARLLEERLETGVLADASVTEAPMRVLASANMPALLVEMGFLSNPVEEEQLASPAFQAAFASAVVDAVTRFRDHLSAGAGER